MVELCPPLNSYVEVLIPSTPTRDHTWKQGHCSQDEVTPEQAGLLIQYDSCPDKRGGWRQVGTGSIARGPEFCRHRPRSSQSPETWDRPVPSGTWPGPHLELGVLGSITVGQYVCVVSATGLWSFVTAAPGREYGGHLGGGTQYRVCHS